MHRQFPEEEQEEEEEEVVEAVHPVPLANLEEVVLVLDLVEQVALELLGREQLEPEVESATERTAAATAIPRSPSRCTAVA